MDKLFIVLRIDFGNNDDRRKKYERNESTVKVKTNTVKHEPV